MLKIDATAYAVYVAHGGDSVCVERLDPAAAGLWRGSGSGGSPALIATPAEVHRDAVAITVDNGDGAHGRRGGSRN